MNIDIAIDANAERVVLKKRTFYRNTPIDDERGAMLWALQACEILMKDEELTHRHTIIDELIEKAQVLHTKINDMAKDVKPIRLAYSFFFTEKRPLVALVHRVRGPNEKYNIAKKVARWWKIISPAEKAKYRLLEEEDRQRYNDIQHYYSTEQHQLMKLIKYFNENRTHILSWPTDMISIWAEMVFKKFECFNKI